MRLLRLKPGHGEIVLAEGDVGVPEEHLALIEAFRHELDQGMWAAVPIATDDGRREARFVRKFDEIPPDTDRVIFFPRAAGGATVAEGATVAGGATVAEASPASRPPVAPSREPSLTTRRSL